MKHTSKVLIKINTKTIGITFSVAIAFVLAFTLHNVLGESTNNQAIQLKETPHSYVMSNYSNHITQFTETEISAKYKNELGKETLTKNQWSDNYRSIQRIITESNVQKNVVLKYSNKMPELTKEMLDKQKHLENIEKRWHPQYFDDKKYYAVTPPGAISLDRYLDVGSKSRSFSSFSVTPHANTSLENHTFALGDLSLISEPAVANHGNVVFMTGNWWAARSTDGGNNFSYINPYSDFSTFCCDQDVVYSDNHNLWVWYRMGDPSVSPAHINVSKIGVSTNDGASWCFFNITASNIDPSLTNHWLDYPNMQVTSDKLYLSTNIFRSDNNTFAATAMLRFDLNGLANCSTTSFDVFLRSTEFNFTPVNGATDKMYFATQLDGSHSKIYRWLDSSSTLSNNTVSYTSYPINGAYSCPITDGGHSPCGRSDPRVLGGYLAHGIIGFVWDAAQGGSFPYPYENYIRVNETTGALIDNPVIFSTTTATNFANTGVTTNGDVGIALFHMGGAQKPAYIVGIHDALTPGSSFDFSTVKTSTNGTNVDDQWGDFVRVKPFKPDNGKWVASGYTLQGGSDSTHIQILYEIFGRTNCGKTIDQFDAFINGTASSDVLIGSGGNDLILGNGGNDKIFGKAGNDCIISGNGNDYISGGAGNDTIFGIGGDDKIWGGPGNDDITVGKGNDRIVGGPGNDILNGNAGNDIIWGQTGDDTIDGGDGSDVCVDFNGTNTATNCERYYHQ
ncbi:MAG: calcium-binding protein [Nitrosopumilaceae archaeon]